MPNALVDVVIDRPVGHQPRAVGKVVLFGEPIDAFGLDIAREIDHREWTAATLPIVGRVHRSCGDHTSARRYHEEMLAIARDLRADNWIGEALSELGQDLLEAGEDTAGVRHLEEALLWSGDAVQLVARPLLALADHAIRQDRVDEALGLARRLQVIGLQWAVFVADAKRAEGEALVALGQVTEGEARIRQAKAEAATINAAPPGWRAGLTLARFLEENGRRTEAEAERATALALLEAIASDLDETPQLRLAFEASRLYQSARPVAG